MAIEMWKDTVNNNGCDTMYENETYNNGTLKMTMLSMVKVRIRKISELYVCKS